MTQLTVEQDFQFARQHHQAGRLAQAEQLYRQILAMQPHHADALLNLGALAHQAGRRDFAVDLIRQAANIRPNWPEAHNNLGVALYETGALDEAIAAYRRAIALKPSYPEAHNNLGNALHAKGQLDAAIAAFREAVALKPGYPEAHSNLGNALCRKGELDEAIAACRHAIALRPNYPEARSNLGNALKENGQLDQAIASYRQAIAIGPNFAMGYNNLGNALREKGQLEESIAACRRAIGLDPSLALAHNNLGNALKDNGQLDEAIVSFRSAIDLKTNYPQAHNNLGNALRDNGRIDEAIASYHQAIALNPAFAAAYGNLGNTLRDRGQLDDAISSYRQAIALDPNCPEVHSNLVYAVYFHPGYDARAIAEEQRRWAHQHADPYHAEQWPHLNDRSPGRRIRIGYVSPDFRDQAESFFTIPMFENHDHAAFEIFCYSSVIKADDITRRIATSADVWRDVRGKSDESLAQIVRDDRIDILVDLTMHMARGRPLLFARKPAPVQVCWLAYPGTTGLKAIDYRITDAFMDPIDADDSVYAEQSVRLPDCWVTYDPLCDVPARPPEQSGPITFGSLNNPCKLNDPLLTLWAKVLETVPQSRLTLLVPSSEHRQRILGLMATVGIAPDRLRFVAQAPRLEYLHSYDRIDIALDPLPYNGITTTCDALYMGTPVLTLAGQTAAGRAGKAMLTTIGLQNWVAHNGDEFIRAARQLAGDLPRLVELRRGLRRRLMQSPLTDAPRFARNIENAYRQMWRTWAERNAEC